MNVLKWKSAPSTKQLKLNIPSQSQDPAQILLYH